MSLTILLIGSGARESTLAWKLSQSPKVGQVLVAPGNGGTGSIAKCSNLPIGVTDFAGLAEAAVSHGCGLIVPGPEEPLVKGVTDYFSVHAPGIPVFGPSAAAAQLEGSKRFSKDFMRRHGIPTAAYEAFADFEAAKAYLESIDHRVVLKADGIAAGKGVLIPETAAEALAALEEIMVVKAFGDAGNQIVIEEFLEGEEISILALCDGKSIVALPAAQDHKRAYNHDKGPNTGGMGTYSPASVATPEILTTIQKDALEKTMAGMLAENTPFVGCLFTGFMLTASGPKVLEYNTRFGDPETESVLPLLESDLAELMLACCEGKLAEQEIRIATDKSAVTVVAAAGGYPGSYAKGTEMFVDEVGKDENVQFFHAGTALDENNVLRTAGGRVLATTAVAESMPAALEKAYEAIKRVKFEGIEFRTDIGHRELVRLGLA